MRYLVCNDIHFGHNNTPTEHIISSFRSILNNYNKSLDVIFIAGDLFDRLLDFNSKEVLLVIDFFHDLLSYCYDNNIYLRILEGTPSHDRQQSYILIKLNEIRTNKCDIKYFKELDIEYIDRINKYVLYIPDEWCNNHDLLEKQIQSKLNLLSIENVDIAILHGQFKYQTLNKKYNGFYFKEEYFLKLVKGYIHIGHYHTYTTFDRIIATGSLERLAHGEEEQKGYVIVNDNSYQFIENTNSYIYKTIKITNKTTLSKLDSIIYKYPKNSHIRLNMTSDCDFNINYNDIKIRYMDYNIKKLIRDSNFDDSSVIYIDNDIDISNSYNVNIDIYNLLLSNILSKNNLTNDDKNKLLKYIDIFKDINNKETE